MSPIDNTRVNMKTIKIQKADVELFSPYSGKCIYGEQAGEYNTETDKTCLFSYFEDTGWDDLSDRVKVQLDKKGVVDIDDITPLQLAELLEFDGSLLIEYNGDRNGISWFAFAPE
jgi:hypothetical protein